MSQFELENIRTDTCEESFQMGQIGKYGMKFGLNNMWMGIIIYNYEEVYLHY